MEIQLRDYQKEAIQKVKENKGRLLLNLCPGAGKTICSLFLKQQEIVLLDTFLIVVHNIDPFEDQQE